MIGVKTGYTSKAGPCLIARAKMVKRYFISYAKFSKQMAKH